MNVGDRIRLKRQQQGLTLQELANRVGATASTIKKWEDGAIKSMKAPRLAKIAQALDTTPAYLMGWEDQISAGNTVITAPSLKAVPVVGSIACGEPILAEQNIEGYSYVDASRDVDFALVCKGYSMINARIYDGDTVYIRQQPTVENGEIAAVLIEDEATLKRVYYYPNKIELRPENPLFPILTFEGPELNNVKILGKAIVFMGEVR